jgi:hypothetical protein
MVLNIDFAPIFLDYAGVRTPAGMQGRGFRSNGEAHTPWDWRKSLYDRWRSVGKRSAMSRCNVRRLLAVSAAAVIGVFPYVAAASEAPAVAYYGAFRELPITDIVPQGWLAEFLDRQRKGLASHHAASGYPFDSCLWTGLITMQNQDANAKAWWPYEQTAYLVDGIYRCGLLLHDPGLTAEGRKNVEYVLDHPRRDGALGPDRLGSTQWPFAVFVRGIMAAFESSGDGRILEALRRHYISLPPDLSGERDTETVEGLAWTYGKTGNKALLDLALRLWAHQYARFVAGQFPTKIGPDSITGHGVTVSETIKQPAILYLYTNDKSLLNQSLSFFKLVERDDVLVDGIPSSQERLSGKAPEKTHETCVISDYTWSMGYMLMATGDASWSDRIERGVFNAGFGAITKDFKAHEYFSSPNQMIAASDTSPWGGKSGARQSYRPGFDVECCSGNVHRFLPNYVARMWMSDGHGGVAATLYGPSTAHLKVGEAATPVTIQEETNYPFDERISFRVRTAAPVRFPLQVRIPAWSVGATIAINGKQVHTQLTAGTFFTMERSFADGDTITLRLPMQTRLEEPVTGGVSISRGPILYALKIAENRRMIVDAPKSSGEFPAWEMTPASPWNYALDVNARNVQMRAKIVSHSFAGFPWTPETASVTIQIPARRVPGWELAPGGKNPPLPVNLQPAPKSETVQLIPYGATCLRVTVFPQAGKSAEH